MNLLNKVNINGFNAVKWSSATRVSLLTGVTNASILLTILSLTLIRSTIPLKTKDKLLQSLTTSCAAITKRLLSQLSLCS